MNLRIVERIHSRIKKLDLDLSNEVVLTEVGSNKYMYTPIIPVLARAKKVYAWVRDSSFGSADLIIEECTTIAKHLNCLEVLEFYKGDFCKQHLNQATIITNSGFIRPIDKRKIDEISRGAVIPLMFEAWELREGDIDIDYAKERGIKIGGTWENHPKLEVFKHVGALALKMAFEAGFEVFNNSILVWSNDQFGLEAAKAFKAIGAKSVVVSTEIKKLKQMDGIDFIFFCDYHGNTQIDKMLINNLSSERLKKIGVVHLYGLLKVENIVNIISSLYPEKDGSNQTMSYTLSHVGINPLIDLLVAGFKVGQVLRSNKKDPIAQII